jgi:fumarate reductase subunit C
MAQEMSRKPYVREMTSEWIFRHPRYLRYMTREFSCLFIGAWTLMLVCALARLSEGPEAWAAFLEGLKSPLIVAFHVVALAFATYHSVTWFNLTPKALPLQMGEEFVPDGAISGAHFVAWGVVSLAILYLAGAF